MTQDERREYLIHMLTNLRRITLGNSMRKALRGYNAVNQRHTALRVEGIQL